MKLLERVKHDHFLMMLICCGIPIILVLIGIYAFNIERKYIVWIVILACPLMHYFMMKDCKKKDSNEEREP